MNANVTLCLLDVQVVFFLHNAAFFPDAGVSYKA